MEQPSKQATLGVMHQQRDSVDREMSGYKHDLDSQQYLHQEPKYEGDYGFEQPLSYPDFMEQKRSARDRNRSPGLTTEGESARIHLSSQYSSRYEEEYSQEQGANAEQSHIGTQMPSRSKHIDQLATEYAEQINIGTQMPSRSHNIDQFEISVMPKNMIFEEDDEPVQTRQSNLAKSVDNLEQNLEVAHEEKVEISITDHANRFMADRKASIQTVQPSKRIGLLNQKYHTQASVSPLTKSKKHLNFDSSYAHAETIVQNLAVSEQDSIVEVDQAMVELEQQQISIIRQVVLVQLRRMLSLLEQIKMTQSMMNSQESKSMDSPFKKALLTDPKDPEFFRLMVHTCAEAILIEVVSQEQMLQGKDPPETCIRQALDRESFNKIVYTWAEELEFEQICSDKVLNHIFYEFDIDKDGQVSEQDLQTAIYQIIKKHAQSKPNLIVSSAASILQVPELELELETERDSLTQPQFESDIKASGRSGAEIHSLLMLKNTSSRELVTAVKEMQSRQGTGTYVEEPIQEKDEDPEPVKYKDFIYIHEKGKLEQMAQNYHSSMTNYHQTQTMVSNDDHQQRYEAPHITLEEQQESNYQSSQQLAYPSQKAVHPRDNSSEVEPDQPAIASGLHSSKKEVPGPSPDYSQGRKTTNTFKSQDDREPSIPGIASEFKSSSRQPLSIEQAQQYAQIDENAQSNDESDKDSMESPELNGSIADDEANYRVTQTLDIKAIKLTNSLNESQHLAASESKTSMHKVTAFEQNDSQELKNQEPLQMTNSDYLSPPILLNQSSSKALMSKPHHGSMPTAEFGNQDVILNPASSTDLLVVSQMKGETASSKVISEIDDPVSYVQSDRALEPYQKDVGVQYNYAEENEQASTQKSVSRENVSRNGPLQASDMLHDSNSSHDPAKQVSSQEKLMLATMSGQKSNHNQPKIQVSFSQTYTEIADEGSVQRKVSAEQQTSAENEMMPEAPPEPLILKQILQPSDLNQKSVEVIEIKQDFFQSSPGQHGQPKSRTQMAKTVVDQGCDPIPEAYGGGVDEREKHGSDHIIHQSTETDKLSNRTAIASIKSATKSEQFLPNKKIKQVGGRSTNNDLQIVTMGGKQSPIENNGNKNAAIKQSRVKPSHSPIQEVQEERSTVKKSKRNRNAEINKIYNSKSPPPPEVSKKMKQMSKSPQQSKRTKKSKNTTKTSPSNFNNQKRQAENNKADELIVQQARAQFTVEQTNKKSAPRRLRKPTISVGKTPSPNRKNGMFSMKRKSATQTQWNDYQEAQQTAQLPSSIRNSPSRVFKTTAKNGLQQTVEPLPKELQRVFNKPPANQSSKATRLKPLNKRLAEARLNGLNASFQLNSTPLVDEYESMNNSSIQDVNTAPMKGIDWGPDPEPVYSSQMDVSRQASQEGMNSVGSIPENRISFNNSIDGALAMNPYQNNTPNIAPINKDHLQTAQMERRTRINKLHTPDLSNNQHRGEFTFSQENFAGLREEHNRTSLQYRRPQDKLNLSTHLYIDEKPKTLTAQGQPISNFDQQLPHMREESFEMANNLQDHKWLIKDKGTSPPRLSMKPKQLRQNYAGLDEVAESVAPGERRSMSNLTRKQMDQAKLRKSLKQQGLLPDAGTSSSFQPRRPSEQKRSITTLAGYGGNQTAGSKEWKLATKQLRPIQRPGKQSGAIATNFDSNDHEDLDDVQVLLKSPIADKQFATLPRHVAESITTEQKEDQYTEIASEGDKSEGKLPTARRSQQHMGNELLAVSVTESTKFQAEEGQTQRNDTETIGTNPRSGIESREVTTKDTRLAEVNHSIEVDMNRDLSPVQENPQIFTTSPRMMNQSKNFLSNLQPVRKSQPGFGSVYLKQAIREKADKRYAAYTKKNVVTMYKSIHNNNKRKSELSHERAEQVYRSFPRPPRQNATHDPIYESEEVQNYQEQVGVTDENDQKRYGSLPTLPQQQQYLVAQPHQQQIIGKSQSRLEYPTKAQMRYHMINEDLANVSNSPRALRNKYRIIASGSMSTLKSMSVLAELNRPVGVSAIPSSTSLISNKFNLRDNNNSKGDLHKIKNMFVHKAVRKQSPTGLSMDVQNRYVMEAMKDVGSTKNRTSTIQQKYLYLNNGALKTKLNNSTAKLNSNFDYQKNSKFASPHNAALRQNSNPRLTQIPLKVARPSGQKMQHF